MKRKYMILVLISVLLPWVAAAGDFDGSRLLLCATIDTVVCSVGGDCARGEAESVNIPHFVDVDVAQKLLRAVGGERTSEIKQVMHQNGQLVLQGVEENGRGWTVSISETTGTVSPLARQQLAQRRIKVVENVDQRLTFMD